MEKQKSNVFNGVCKRIPVKDDFFKDHYKRGIAAEVTELLLKFGA